jgi:hypothetical protein
MKSQRPVILGVLVVAALLAFWYLTRGSSVDNEIDLIARLATLAPDDRRSTVQEPDQFSVGETTVDGTARRTILARPHSRLIYTVTVPPDAWLEVAFAMKPESWDQPGDGAQFRVGVSDGRTYEELLRQYVNPKRGDRRWFSVRLDLSAYEGREVKLIFNTDPGPPEGRDTANDLAVWADPRVYSKR